MATQFTDAYLSLDSDKWNCQMAGQYDTFGLELIFKDP